MVAHLFNRAPHQARTATPLLAFVAGDFADAIAQLWPAPHGDFFALPAARRHAAAVLLADIGGRRLTPADLRHLLTYQRDAAVAAALAGQAETGLMRALAKGGELLWKRDDYATFMRLMADPMANEVLRHLDDVRPEIFAPIAVLPPALRMAPIVRVIPCLAAAEDLARAFQLAILMRDADAGARIARRWGAGGDTRAVFLRASEDLTPDVFCPAAPAPALNAPLVRVVNRKQLEQAALDFRNCLADHGGRIAEGKLAVYVWAGEPKAAIALARDAAGWRLAEAKAPDNVDLGEAFLRNLAARLFGAGVRTGPSVQTMLSRLDDWSCGHRQRNNEARSFMDDLALGDLWS